MGHAAGGGRVTSRGSIRGAARRLQRRHGHSCPRGHRRPALGRRSTSTALAARDAARSRAKTRDPEVLEVSASAQRDVGAAAAADHSRSTAQDLLRPGCLRKVAVSAAAGPTAVSEHDVPLGTTAAAHSGDGSAANAAQRRRQHTYICTSDRDITGDRSRWSVSSSDDDRRRYKYNAVLRTVASAGFRSSMSRSSAAD